MIGIYNEVKKLTGHVTEIYGQLAGLARGMQEILTLTSLLSQRISDIESKSQKNAGRNGPWQWSDNNSKPRC